MATINGTSGNNTLNGTSAADSVTGFDGSDLINAGVGNDTVYAGVAVSANDRDTVNAGTGNDLVYGGDGNDLVDGGSDNDTIYGEDGDDSVLGGAGNDSIEGGEGRDTIDGGSNDDRIAAGNGADNVSGSAGNDTIQSSGGADTVDGGSGNDRITAGGSNDKVLAQSGDDTVEAGVGNDSIWGHSGNDSLVGDTGDVYVDGHDGSNLVTNGSFENPDVAAGSYSLFPGSVPGWTIASGPSVEVQDNYPGLANGFDGSQYVELDSTANTRIAQDIATNGTSQFVLEFAYTPRPGVDAASNEVQVYWNGTLLDTLTGDSAAWSLHSYTVSGAGANTALEFASSGTSDGLGGFIDAVSVKAVAQDNNDYVNGGSGNDTLTGGGGNDTFSFTKKDGVDVITDYTIGKDHVELVGYTGGNFATTIAPHLSQDGLDTLLDLGDGQTIRFQNVDHTLLTSSDFVFV